MFVLKWVNIHSVQTADDNNLTSKEFSKLVLYLDRTAISCQINNYLTTNRGNFLKMQCGCYRYALLAVLLWLAVESALFKNSRKTETWLFGASLWKIIKALWLVKYSCKFAFNVRRSWNSEFLGLWWHALVFELTS